MVSPTKARVWSLLRWLWLLPIPLLWCIADRYGALTPAENRTLDWRFQVRGELKPPVKIIYADVDSLSLSEIGGWPWNRSYFSRVAAAVINTGKAKAVGFDFVLSDLGISESVDWKRMVTGNVEFGRFLHRDPPVVLAAAYGGWQYVDLLGKRQERTLPLVGLETRPVDQLNPPEVPTFETSSDPEKTIPISPHLCGLIDTIDNGTRTVPAYAPSNVRTYYHMSFELARLAWGLPPDSIKVGPTYIDFTRADRSIHARVPLEKRQLIEVNWFTHWNSPYTAHIEFSTLYKYAAALDSEVPEERAAGAKFFAESDFRDAVVLVGPVDPLLQDLAPTPLDTQAVPRVGVHGNMLMTLLSGQYLRRLPPLANDGIVVILACVMAGLAIMGGARAVFAKVLAILLVVGYGVGAFYGFAHGHLILPLVAPVGAAFTTSFAGLIWQVIAEQKAKGRIKGMFGTYLAPTVVERMIESGKDPELGGHDAEITAYFSDIQSFSSFSEVLPSSKLGELLNEYLTACTDIVQAEMGTLDKYIGDAVVAMFGAPVEAPDHAYRACLAAQRVQERLAELRLKWSEEQGKWPELVHHLRTRIGLNTGVCMIGNMGSRTRFNYTMMGDNVNLAARMESGAKSWGVYTLCTETTRAACEQHAAGTFLFRPLGRIVVKGRTQPVPIFESVGLRAQLAASTLECVALFEQGLAKYYQRDWEGALALFARSGALEPMQPGSTVGVSTNPSIVYTEIVTHCRLEPPAPTWDGRYVMKEK